MSHLYVLLPPLNRFDGVSAMQQWLARGDALDPGDEGELAAASCFHWSGGGSLPVGAIEREQSRGDAGEATWLCADLAHVQPDVNGARMMACGDLNVSAEDAETLAKPLRPLFGDSGMRLCVTTPARWHVQLPRDSPLPPFDTPGQVLGDDLTDHLPAGDTGRRWRQLFNEAQILLHQQPLNGERQQQGHPAVNSLWFWGGGRLPDRMRSLVQHVYADDGLPRSLAGQANARVHALTEFDATARVTAETLLDLGRSGSPQGCSDMLLGMLQSRRVKTLTLHFAGGERWHIERRHRWRIWRRAR